jgi:hypothetical protein
LRQTTGVARVEQNTAADSYVFATGAQFRRPNPVSCQQVWSGLKGDSLGPHNRHVIIIGVVVHLIVLCHSDGADRMLLYVRLVVSTALSITC